MKRSLLTSSARHRVWSALDASALSRFKSTAPVTAAMSDTSSVSSSTSPAARSLKKRDDEETHPFLEINWDIYKRTWMNSALAFKHQLRNFGRVSKGGLNCLNFF